MSYDQAMHLGETANAEAASWGKPLDGVRILAAEQMQALPYATQLLPRLGAEVVKVEHPVTGDSGRGALPAVKDIDGRSVGATYLRNNLGKRSIGIALDERHQAGASLAGRGPAAPLGSGADVEEGDGAVRLMRRACDADVARRRARRSSPT
jgi:hypothetical protein